MMKAVIFNLSSPSALENSLAGGKGASKTFPQNLRAVAQTSPTLEAERQPHRQAAPPKPVADDARREVAVSAPEDEVAREDGTEAASSPESIVIAAELAVPSVEPPVEHRAFSPPPRQAVAPVEGEAVLAGEESAPQMQLAEGGGSSAGTTSSKDDSNQSAQGGSAGEAFAGSARSAGTGTPGGPAAQILPSHNSGEAAGPGISAPPVTLAAHTTAEMPPIPPTPLESSAGDANLARVARALQSAVSQHGGAVTLRLHPAEMGMVRIDLEIRDGAVNAQLHAEHESVRHLLAHQLRHLRQALERQGLVVERLTVQTEQVPAQTESSEQQPWREDSADGRSRGRFAEQPPTNPQRRQSGAERPSFAASLLNLVG